MEKVLFFCEVRSENELIPTVCHTILINHPVSEVIPFLISRQLTKYKDFKTFRLGNGRKYNKPFENV